MKMNAITSIMSVTLALLLGISTATAKRKPAPAPINLTEQGKALAAAYQAELDKLKTELNAAIPSVDKAKMETYQAALKAEVEAKAAVKKAHDELGAIKKGNGLVGHAKGKWIGGADKGIAATKKKLEAAKTAEERAKLQEELTKWEKNRADGVAALKERQAFLDEALAKQPMWERNLKAAELALAKAKRDVQAALDTLKFDNVLTSDKLDAKLAKVAVMQEATPKGLAAFAQQSKENEKLIADMLKNDELLIQMAVADGAAGGNYGRAMEIYSQIQKTSDKASSGIFQRLALAIALEHATPISQRNPKADTDAPAHVPPVARYTHYETAYLNNELDPGFSTFTAWDLRFVVNGYEPDDTLAWGREMLRNYRPDHITTNDRRWRYLAAVRSEIRYGSQENKFDQDDLQFFQNILKNGGICGRRAFFGRFILRSFGVPTTARPQPGHAALARWTPDGWVVALGGGWGAGTTKTAYTKDLDFLATTQARATGDNFLQVKRAQWIGDLKGEPRVWGLNDPRNKPAFWNSISLATQRDLIANAKTLDAVGEDIGEANVTKEKIDIVQVEISEEDRKIHLDDKGSIIIPAAATTAPTKSSKKIIFMDSVLGGKQLHYSRNGGDVDFTYTVDAPEAGTYQMRLKIVTPSWKQKVAVSANGGQQVEFELPHTVGHWMDYTVADVTLKKGKNVLTFTRKGLKQDVAIKGFTLKQITLSPKG